ncbi:hypothetical protein K438DRAFT_1986594 [Mycena galopus ATCC 62051]|nr:hypothetical protein K438DRAFT_1986594 [Mycena galopus ATCC 62051]
MTSGERSSKQIKAKPGRALAGIFILTTPSLHQALRISDTSNGRHKWVSPAMAEFRGSSAVNPWVLDSHGELVLHTVQAKNTTFTMALGVPAKTVSAPVPKHKRIFKGPRSSLKDPPVPKKVEGSCTLRAVEADSDPGRKAPSHIRAARDRINQTPRVLSANSGEGSRISSAATRPVRRTAAEKARQNLFDDWQFM